MKEEKGRDKEKDGVEGKEEKREGWRGKLRKEGRRKG